MAQRPGALAEEVTQTISRREVIADKLEALERRLTEAAENVTTTYARMLTETTDGVERMAGEAARALNPLHQTRAHPGIMLGVALCAGYLIGRVQTRAHAIGKGPA